MKSVAAALFAVLLPASLAADTPSLQLPYTQFTLPNGLHVILHEDHSVPVVSVNVWYHVGSGRERAGRTGFAHLFEHLMFMGSGHVKPGEFDSWLEGAGGQNNGSTEYDRTNYWINVPSNALELALFLESDRMGYLLDTMTPQTVDAQRDVVKNERRQSVENRPYGTAEDVVLGEMLYPEGHPYHWPVIGYMPDLTAASYDDVVAFFKKFYSPANASLVVAGDIDIGEHAPARREVVRRRQARTAGRTDHHSRRDADRRAEEDGHRSRAVAATLPGLAHAASFRARRCRAGRRRRRPGGREELTAVQAPRLRHADRAEREGLAEFAGAVVVFLKLRSRLARGTRSRSCRK